MSVHVAVNKYVFVPMKNAADRSTDKEGKQGLPFCKVLYCCIVMLGWRYLDLCNKNVNQSDVSRTNHTKIIFCSDIPCLDDIVPRGRCSGTVRG